MSREDLHRLIDALPEEALEAAFRALERSAEGSESGPRLDHAAAWVDDLERARGFYEKWFGDKMGSLYSSARRPLQTYFLDFGAGGGRLELMKSPGEPARHAHIALSLGSRDEVDLLYRRMSEAGVTIAGEPRLTGDGCYEAVIEDSEGNLVEITA